MARGDPINRGALTGYIASAQERGLSARGALRELRASGLGVQDRQLYDTWREVRQVRTNAAAVADLPGNSVVPDHLHVDRPSGRREGYLYNVQVMIRTDDGELISRPHSVASDDPMMVNDIMAVAADETEAGIESGTDLGATFFGAVLVSGYHMTASN